MGKWPVAVRQKGRMKNKNNKSMGYYGFTWYIMLEINIYIYKNNMINKYGNKTSRNTNTEDFLEGNNST